LTELTASIAEKGVLEPLLVKPSRATGRWMIIEGERRYRADRAAGKRHACVADDRRSGVAELRADENMQRKDLNGLGRSDGLSALCEGSVHA